MGCEDGLHSEGKVGSGQTQDARCRYFYVCRSRFSRDCKHYTRDYIVCGPVLGLKNVGRVALIHRALYGGKTAGRDVRNHLGSCMRDLDFLLCPADPGDQRLGPTAHSITSISYFTPSVMCHYTKTKLLGMIRTLFHKKADYPQPLKVSCQMYQGFGHEDIH